MFDKDRWIEIFETIKKNKLRTFLAGFTVALGIFIFIMLFGLANGLENTFEKYFKDDQLNTIWINGSRTSKPYAGYESNRRIRLKNEDLEDIQNKYDSQTKPYYAASRLWIDAIIDPKDTRKWISLGIEAANNNPAKEEYKTGVIQT